MGGPLGLIGAMAQRTDFMEIVARLVVPIGALLEPFVIGMFTSPAIVPWPTRLANVSCEVVLLAAGTTGCIKVLGAARKRSSAEERRVVAEA